MNEKELAEMVRLLLQIKQTNGMPLRMFQSIAGTKPYALYMLDYVKVERRGEDEYVVLDEKGEEFLTKLLMLRMQKT